MGGLPRSCLRQLKNDRWLRAVVVLALFGCLLFFALHVARLLAGSPFDPGQALLRAGFAAREFSIGTDRGYAEIFEYLVLACIVIAFARLSLTLRQPVYVAFFLIFLFSLADNSLRIHEIFGEFLASRLDLAPAFGLRAKDFGELITWALFGVPLLGFLGVALWRSAGRHRTAGLALTAWFFVLAFFGVAVDMMSIVASDYGVWKSIVSFVEDGGEMLVIVVILALVLAVPAYLREADVADQEPAGTPV